MSARPRARSLQTKILAVVLLGVSVPSLLGGWYLLRRHQELLTEKLQENVANHLFRRANEAMMKSEFYAYRDRRNRRRDLRRLWIARINAACRAEGITYSAFLAGLKKAKVGLDRKMLAELAVKDAKVFKKLTEIAKG